MVAMRKVSIPIYATAFVISLMIFISGVFVGQLIDASNLQDLSSDVEGVSQKLNSVQLLLLLEGNSSSFCPVYSAELDAIDAEVEQVGYKLSYLEEQKQAFDMGLKKDYFALQAQSYLLSKKVNEICGKDTVLLINFYSNTDCGDCRQQGDEILEARDELQQPVKLYSFDGELGSPVADAFKTQYGVTSYPSLVIDEQLYEGYMDSESIKQAIRGAG